MKKFFVGLLTLCLCLFAFTACEETPPSTPEPPPVENPQPEEETPPTEEVEEPQTTVTTEISLMGNTWGLLMSEFYGNQIQKEVFLDVCDGSGQCFEYGYNKDGDLETFAWNETYNLYVSKSENLLFTLEQGENGNFTGATAENDVSVTIELHENGAIKKRELLFGNPSEGGYIVGVEFDEKNRRLTGYTTYSDDTYLMCRYAYENNSIYSTSCTMTVMDNGDDMLNDQGTFTRENGFLTNLYIENEELNCSFEYLPNGNFSSSTTTYYNNNVVWQKNSIAFTYSDTGLVSQVIKKNYHSENQIETEFICNYNAKGLITNSEYITYKNGDIISKSTTEIEYNSNEKRTKSTSQTMEYINNTFVLKDTTVTEYTTDGSISTTTHYNTDGSYYIEISEYENSGCKITTMRYDENGFLWTKGIEEYKYVSLGNGAMGSVTIKSTITYYQPNDVILVFESEYNDDRKTTKKTETKYTNGNIEYILTKTYEYDSDGYVLVCKCVRCDGLGNIIEEWEE